MLRAEDILPRLRRFPWGRHGARWVLVYGSLARKGTGRDIDLLVMGIDGIDDVLNLVVELAEYLGLDPGLVDVVPASNDTPCAIVLDAWRNGIVVYAEDAREAREWLLRRAMICHDYSIMARKLRVVETAVRAARRRWGR